MSALMILRLSTLCRLPIDESIQEKSVHGHAPVGWRRKESMVRPFPPIVERICGRLINIDIEADLIWFIFESLGQCNQRKDSKQTQQAGHCPHLHCYLEVSIGNMLNKWSIFSKDKGVKMPVAVARKERYCGNRDTRQCRIHNDEVHQSFFKADSFLDSFEETCSGGSQQVPDWGRHVPSKSPYG